MKLIIKFLVSALAIVLVSYVLPGVALPGQFWAALWVAVLLSVFNSVLKPIFIIFTLPITLVTFGLFLLVINTCMLMLADYFIEGFHLNGFLTAFIFSLLYTVAMSVLESIFGLKDDNNR